MEYSILLTGIAYTMNVVTESEHATLVWAFVWTTASKHTNPCSNR